PNRIPFFLQGEAGMRADRRWRTRKEKKEWARRLQSNDPGLDVIHPEAAGIDIGNASHYVAGCPTHSRFLANEWEITKPRDAGHGRAGSGTNPDLASPCGL